MLATMVLAVLVTQTPADVSNLQAQEHLQQAATAPDPINPEQPWPPAGVFRPGGDVTLPRLVKETRPNYRVDAMRAKVQGTVVLEAVVLTDGSVGEVRVVRSLDKKYGLDDECVNTVKGWRFAPGMKDGIAVPVVVEVKMTFVLASEPQTDGWMGIRPNIRRL
jgi:protein TonB